EARSAATPDAAGDLLRRALSLWRGPALSDLSFEAFAAREQEGLNELRLVAVSERIEADLSLGRHAELVGELEALVAQHPLQERLRAQLMLALYRSGRQAEALLAYQDARGALVEELGLEPGQELRRLEQAILRQDSSLEPALSSREPAAVVTPPVEPPRGQRARKTVSALVARLSGWTEIAERLDPEAAHGLASGYHREAERVLARHGGTVTEAAGESVVAVFGVPVSHEDDALRAVRAALELRSELQPLVQELYRDLGVDVGVKLAITTGAVVADVGHRGDVVVVGNALAVAARLVDRAEPGEILVGTETRGLVVGAVRAERVDGRGDGVQAWRLIGLSLDRPGFASPLVGRDRELDAARDVLARATMASSFQLCTVVGPPGIGKSRFAHELVNEASATAAVAVGHCP
ncbi:MAG: BTAD domain-containing putative transcriptional regulator, partial [Gaiellaceae bacterium]